MNAALLAALHEGALVVTPNRRLARWIHREFDLVQRARGLLAWPTPSILPYPQWLEALWNEAIAFEGLVGNPLLFTPAQSALLWRQVVEADADRTPLLDERGASVLAIEAWSLVHQWSSGGGESWRAWHRDDAVLDDPAVFARWADDYLARMHAARARDLALVPDALTSIAKHLRCVSSTVLAGFVEPSPQQQRLLGALREAGADVRLLETLPDVYPRASRVNAPTPRDELASALSWARERAIARPQARIGIVIEDLLARREEVVALADDLLSPGAEADVAAPFEISLGPRLADVPLVAAALDLIALVEAPLAMGAAAALLRSPYLPGAETEWAARAWAERTWLDEGKLEVTLSDAIAALERCSPELAARWRGARDASRAQRRSTPREWSDAWRSWLSAAGWPGTRPLDSAEYQAQEAWERLLLQVATLGVVAPRLSPARAVATLQALASEQRFQPEGGSASIAILGVLEAAGIAFDALWVAGLASDRWPAAPSPNPLLPIAWQRERNVAHATPQREREYAEALTSLFARSASEVVFSSPARVDEHELSASALILPFPPAGLPSRAPSWADDIAQNRIIETVDDEKAPPLPRGARVRGGSRIVAAQSDCPFQAVIRCRLRTEPWPSPCAGLTPLERGSLVHDALKEFWTSVGDHQTLVALDEGNLAGRIATAIAKALAEVSPARWRSLPPLLRDGEAQRLERLLRSWLSCERDRPPFVARALEARVLLQLSGVELSLQLDRIDALSDGGVAILDYKTGQVDRPRQWFDARPRSSQIGLYTLAQRAASPDSDMRAVGYVELRPEGVSVVGIAADEAVWPLLETAAGVAPEGTWSGLEAWWRDRLGALAAEIAAGHAAVAPRFAPSPCRNCGLQPVCRIESVRAIEPAESPDA